MLEHLKELKIKTITYHMGAEWYQPPVVDDFLVTVNEAKKTTGMVYLVASQRLIKTRDGSFKYKLGIISCPELKDKVVQNHHNWIFFINHKMAFPIVWDKR